MRNLFNRLTAYVRQSAAALIVGAALGSLLTAPFVALALTIPPNFAPRQFPTQQAHYIRFTVNFNSCAPAGACSFKVGALPYNAWLVRITYQGFTGFGSTTNLISLGTTSGGTNILAAVTGFQSAVAFTTNTTFAGVGLAVTGNGATQTGGDGGFDLWATMTLTGATPTAGQAVFVLEYIAPNDGTCAPVPMNTTAGAC